MRHATHGGTTGVDLFGSFVLSTLLLSFLSSSQQMTTLLEEQFPHSTPCERKRFQVAFGKHGAERLEAYLKWREEHDLNAVKSALTDADDWREAASAAIRHHAGDALGGRKSRKQRSETKQEIPQLLFYHEIDGKPLCDSQGHLVLQHLPARISLADHSWETFATALALYLDRKLDRENESQQQLVTLLIDVRPGTGWPNPPAIQMISFIRHVAHFLHQLYPGRLHQCILYPIPKAAIHVWNIVKVVLPARDSITLLPGSAHVESTVPVQLETLVSHLEHLEQTRLAAFDG